MPLSRTIALAGAAVLAATSLLAAAPAQSQPQPSLPAHVGGATTTIQLITGDLVHWSNGRVVMARGGAGRKDMEFVQQRLRGDVYVIPVDAAALVAAGRVDRRLFNVTKLAEYGYDATPLIVTYDSASSVGRGGGRTLPSINGEAVRVGKGQTGSFWAGLAGQRSLKAGASKIWLDAPVRAGLDRSVGQIGAPAAWQAGHTGKGVTVAVLDTGIDAAHPDLADAIVGAQDFTDSPHGTKDLIGHGTHVAGTITGDGTASGGKYAGVAPDAKLLNAKVLSDFGEGPESGIIAGMEWAVAQGADVVNMSLGTLQPGDGTAPMDLALNRLTRESGVLFVVSAGNGGPDAATLGSPGTADEALTVGAVDRDESLAGFSSRGPRLNDFGLKPDITGPGVNIVAALAEGSVLGEQGTVIDGKYLSLSGTSMAAPHVAGAAAIVAGARTDWGAGELKSALMNSAKPNQTLTAYQQGAGRVDVARAVEQTVVATPAGIDNGVARWPHHDDQPITRDITYRNFGDTALTLTLSITASAPAGMFTLDRQSVMVPARGTATAKVVTNTAVPAQDKPFDGAVVATGGETTVRTPIGVVREPESYDVTMDAIDRDGKPTGEFLLRFVDINSPAAFFPYDPSGRMTARIPKGRYFFDTQVFTRTAAGPNGFETALFIEPELVVDRDLNLTLDSRRAKQVGLQLDEPDARPAIALFEFIREMPSGLTGLIFIGNNFDGVRAVPSMTTALTGRFTHSIFSILAKPDGRGGFANSPYLYHVATTTEGRVPESVALRVRDRDLVTVRTRIASADAGQIVSKDYIVDLVAPATIIERYTPGVQWFPSLYINREAEFGLDGALSSTGIVYQAGKPIEERWNVGVFGPSLDLTGTAPVSREGNQFGFSLSLFADQPANHLGNFINGQTAVTLKRNGQTIGEESTISGTFAVPDGTGPFQLEAKATRPNRLSTQINARWTFASPQGQQPLMAVRFAPDLDDHNRAKAGRPFRLPVSVQQAESAARGKLKDLRVQVSYDDGHSWRSVLMVGNGKSRTAILFHPHGNGFVSLRAMATDGNGNAVEQTIIRAYELVS